MSILFEYMYVHIYIYMYIYIIYVDIFTYSIFCRMIVQRSFHFLRPQRAASNAKVSWPLRAFLDPFFRFPSSQDSSYPTYTTYHIYISI